MVNVMAVNAVKVRNKTARRGYRMTVRPWMLASVAILIVSASILGYDMYSGRLGIIGSQPIIVANGPRKIIKVPPGGNVQAASQEAAKGRRSRFATIY